MKEVTVTKTIVCPLETSKRKNKRIKQAIDEWQEMASKMGDAFISFPERRWGNHSSDTHMYRWAKEMFSDREIYAANMAEALAKVSSSYESWKSNGRPGEKPKFGDGDYIRYRNDQIDIVRNDEGYGIKVPIFASRSEPPEWWHINSGEYQNEYLSKVVEGDADSGTIEIHMGDSGSLAAHIVVKETADAYEIDGGEIESVVGVDLGINVLYAAAALGRDGSVGQVAVEPADEFLHNIRRLRRKRDEAQKQGRLYHVRDELMDERNRYAEQVTDVVSREIVDMAVDQQPSAIALEDLTHLRSNVDSVHVHQDFRYSQIKEKVLYKAKAEGIPVIDGISGPTSITCSSCGETWDDNVRNPRTIDFKCPGCGYENHADVNAAFNIAERGWQRVE